MKPIVRKNPDGSITVGIIEDEAAKDKAPAAPKEDKKPARKKTK